MNELLTTAAEVSVALAGFSGLFVAFSKRGGALSPVERYALLFLLFCSLGAVVLSMLPFVLAALTGTTAFQAWYCLFSGLVIVSITVWTVWTPLRKVPDGQRRYPWLRRVWLPLQWLVGLLQLAPILASMDAFAAYALAVWWLVFAAAVQFILQVAAATRTDGEPD